MKVSGCNPAAAAKIEAALPEGGGTVHAAALEGPGVESLAAIFAEFPDPGAGPVWVLTCGSRRVLPEDTVDPAQAAIHEFALRRGAAAIDLGAAWAESLPGLADAIRSGMPEAAVRGGRLCPAPPARASGGRLELHIRERGSIDHVDFRPAVRKAPGPDQIEIEVDAAAISFRDVLNALGMYPGDPGHLGGECAGRVAAVGERVTRFAPGDEVAAVAAGAHDGYVLAHEHMTMRRPPNLTLEDALTLPSSFLTAIYTLEHLAGIRAGQRVLIHAGAGGVGLAAIQIAQRAGAIVFATAGSDEKRAYLRSLGVEHTASSRNADFLDSVRRHGGADIVLNSLANELLEASFEALVHGGTFIEIGKNGIRTPEEVERMGKGIRYHIVDWSVNAREEPELFRGMMARIADGAAKGDLKPLPKTVFPFAEHRDAFRHIARARHIGRVLLRQPASAPVALRVDGAYAAAGDLRGAALEAAKWLAERGARNLVLLGAGPPPPEALGWMRAAARQGVRVTAARLDNGEAALAALGDKLRGIAIAGDGVEPERAWGLYRAAVSAPPDFFAIVAGAQTPAAEGLAEALRARGIRAGCYENLGKMATGLFW